ncbi:MAG: hypothetical protein M3Q97_09330 [Bacteroidota bacterium]|nr:hypothetical protein [Bacteroidota bacterium]
MILSRIKSILKKQRYILYEEPYKLNIVGLRSRHTEANKFDDEIHVFYKTEGHQWNYHVFKCTTDPGTFWLNNPSQPEGTAILLQGQYKGAYALGKHANKYLALVQVKPVTIIRDYDRNNVLSFNKGKRVKGNFGINIHRALSNGRTKYIDKHSAGCQVFQNTGDFDLFMKLCARHGQLYDNTFTYTLIDFRAMRRETYRRMAMAASLVSSIVLGYFGIKNFQQTLLDAD